MATRPPAARSDSTKRRIKRLPGFSGRSNYAGRMSKTKSYKEELRELQIALVRYQQWSAESGAKAVLVLEGRDSAGKDGAIKRITEHLTPRRTRAVALPKPDERERPAGRVQ